MRWSPSRLNRFIPGKEPQYPFNRRLGRRFGFKHRTFQPVAHLISQLPLQRKPLLKEDFTGFQSVKKKATAEIKAFLGITAITLKCNSWKYQKILLQPREISLKENKAIFFSHHVYVLRDRLSYGVCMRFRYLVASRDLRPDDIIMMVDPLVVGPPQGCQPLCLGCYKKLDLEVNTYRSVTESLCSSYFGLSRFNGIKQIVVLPRCEGCGWPQCGKDCPGRGIDHGHSAAECQLYERVRPKLLAADSSNLTVLYLVVVPLRCLLLQSDTDKWRTLLTMESHTEIRRKLPAIWRNNQENVVNRIRKEWGMVQYDEELIHTVCGILEV